MRMTRPFLVGLAVASMFSGPLAARAGAETRTPHADITIVWDGEFDRAHGVTSGRGTMADPYVISGWTVGNISIKDTDKAIRIVNNTIGGALTLNWLGPDITVRSNTIADLRVNENNPRWGDPTSGVIEHNTFTRVGQLRHFDGSFAYNTVGAPQSGTLTSSYPDTQAVNFDGFNGAHFAHNVIYGFVDARLHGHHHSSGFGRPSHMHAGGPGMTMPMDHTRRYHEVFIEHNSIFTSHAYALSYLDTNHAGNDRTANSETNPYLNAPHTHYTRVHITSNRLSGAGLLVNVFNAADEKHTGTPSGALDITGNTITIGGDGTRPTRVVQGIEIDQARFLALRITRNSVNGAAPLVDLPHVRSLLTQGVGLLMNGLDHATVSIDTLTITDKQIGVKALQFTKSVTWSIKRLSTSGVDKPVVYDATVANPPRRS